MPSSAAPVRAADDVGSLRTTIEAADTVVRQSMDILDGLATIEAEDRPELDVVTLARDSAALIRAHTTKISLLVINEPFTPSAISKVLRELISGPIPSLLSATQLCVSNRYTAPFRDILIAMCRGLMHALRDLIQIIPTNGKGLSNVLEKGVNLKERSLQVTGIVWNRCDEVKRLADKGILGCLVEQVERYRDELKDVMEELKGWGEETGDSEDEDDTNEFGGPENKLTAAQDMLDDIMKSHSTIPANDPDKIRDKLDSCLRRLRLMTLLYQAVNKRRIKTLPRLPTSAPNVDLERVGNAFCILGGMTDGLCDVADAFYSLDKERIDLETKAKFGEASRMAELFKKPWGEGENDEFTTWATKFQEEIAKS